MAGEGLGPTGNFPEGKLNEHDEGGIVLGVAHDTKLVHIGFGKPIASVAMPPAQARGLAELMVHHADAVDSGGEARPAPRLSEQEYRVLLDLFVVSDPWPLTMKRDRDSHTIVMALLQREAKARGLEDWSVAYHRLPALDGSVWEEAKP